jgi:hypothetical protein
MNGMLYYCTIWDDLKEEPSTNSKQYQEKENNTKSKIPAGLFPFTPHIDPLKNFQCNLHQQLAVFRASCGQRHQNALTPASPTPQCPQPSSGPW